MSMSCAWDIERQTHHIGWQMEYGLKKSINMFSGFFSPKLGISALDSAAYSRLVISMTALVCCLFPYINFTVEPGHGREGIFIFLVYFAPLVGFSLYIAYRCPPNFIPIAFAITAFASALATSYASFIGETDHSSLYLPCATILLLPLAGVFPIFPKSMFCIMISYMGGLIALRYSVFANSPKIESTWLYCIMAFAASWGFVMVFHILFNKLSHALLDTNARVNDLTKTNALLNISMSQNQFGFVAYNSDGVLEIERGTGFHRVFDEKRDHINYKTLSALENNFKRYHDVDLNQLFEELVDIKSSHNSFLLRAYRLDDLVIVSHFDTTNISRMEEKFRLRQKLALIGEITSGVAHNYNNSLAVALSNLESIPEYQNDPLIRDHIRPSIHAIKQSAELSRKLLTLAGRQRFSWEELNVSHTIESTRELIQSAVGSTIALDVQTSPDLYILTDRQEFESAILNLVINSKSAIHKPGGQIKINARALNDRVVIDVEDNGRGIPADIQDKVFDPFFSTKTSQYSSGLGLSTVKGFVEQSKGDIALASDQNGTCFTLSFPKIKTSNAIAPQAASNENRTPLEDRSDSAKIDKIAKINVLIVDDNDLVAQSMERLVSKMGYDAKFETDISASIRHLKEETILTHVFLDLSMPEMDGIKLGEHMLDIRPNINLYLFTGDITSARIDEAKSKGFRDVFIKPVRSAQIHEVLTGHKAESDFLYSA